MKSFQLVLLAFLLQVSTSFAAGVNIPGKQVEVLAPGGKYLVRFQKIEAEGPYGPHGLFLVNTADGHSDFILGFERSADVLWSPDGSSLALTNWVGSNVSEVIVMYMTDKRKVDLQEVLSAHYKTMPWSVNTEVLHVYYEALKWESPTKLKFRVFGHGVPKEQEDKTFDYRFTYETSGKIIE